MCIFPYQRYDEVRTVQRVGWQTEILKSQLANKYARLVRLVRLNHKELTFEISELAGKHLCRALCMYLVI